MLLDDVKRLANEAAKARKGNVAALYRLVVGEVQTNEARTGKAPTDDDVVATVRRLVKANEETRDAAPTPEARAELEAELALLGALLPKGPSAEEVGAALAPVEAAIKGAPNDGAATGIAMKHLKSTGKTFGGNDVSAAVKRLRA